MTKRGGRRPGEQSSKIERRTFLTITAATAAMWVTGCGDDGIGGVGTDTEGSSSDDTTTDETSTSSSGSTSTGDTGTGESSTGTDTEGPAECGDPEEIAFDPFSVPPNAVMFPLAIMAGEMQTDSFMVALYIEDAEPKTLRVWQDTGGAGTVWLVHEETVTPNADGYLKVTVSDLCPGTWYRYAVFSGDPDAFNARSIIGEVRTAIADDALEPLVVALTACNGDSFDWPALEYTADEYYDLFLHLGDMAYNDGLFSLDEYRENWKAYLSVAGMKEAYARSGLYATWDDHEIDNNSNFDPRTMDPMDLQKRQNAMDAYFELLPIDAEGPNYRLWRTFRWGLTAEFIVLDCRYERRPSQDIYISQEQMDFLKQRLLESPCHFKVVLNSVPITNMPWQWDIAANDRWDGFPAQRAELLDHITDNGIENVWFVSGDFHVNFVSRLEPMGGTLAARTREIAVTGGETNPVPPILLSLNEPQFDYGVNQARGIILTLDPDANAVNVRFIDPDTGDDDYNETLTQD